ncbi:MAG TPA: radical SAM protein [Candidatus Omnitrophota bacterium]|nr:radical SAM protein [Candidatus Omnitrophota bacterium]
MKNKILDVLGCRPIVIWGARMTGVGFLRFSVKNGLHVIHFVDSDPSLENSKIHDIPVARPDYIQQLRARYKDLIVLIAVSIKEDEIIDVLKKMGLTENDYVKYADFCGYFFTIDVAGVCNLKCPSCGNSIDGIDNPKGFMSFDDFKKVAKKMMDETGLVSHINLYSWGEPFLHPDLASIIEHTHSLGVAAAVSTNLSIPSLDKIEKIIRSDPDYLKISVSGYCSEVYNTTHTGGDIELIKTNMRKLREFIDKYRVSTVVEVIYHLYANNTGDDLTKMKKLCDDLGFVFATCYANITPIERLIDYCEGRPDKQVRELSDLLLVNIDEALEVTKGYRNSPCRFLTNQVNINWDRSVPLCCVCFDYKTSTVSADYLKDSLEDIFNKRKNHPICVKCMKYGFPPYLLGVNQKGWQKVADEKLSGIRDVKNR